jgi:hypothetical protein
VSAENGHVLVVKWSSTPPKRLYTIKNKVFLSVQWSFIGWINPLQRQAIVYHLASFVFYFPRPFPPLQVKSLKVLNITCGAPKGVAHLPFYVVGTERLWGRPCFSGHEILEAASQYLIDQ